MDKNRPTITVEVTVNKPVQQVWNYWTKPEHITQWNFAGDDWHCPSATRVADDSEQF
ncbi:MAG TPA: SRPBCC domain-containing protein [Bacteroidales bacterium]|nr:SRPBCC domain-containing protein [Bacteroidales bacterium]